MILRWEGEKQKKSGSLVRIRVKKCRINNRRVRKRKREVDRSAAMVGGWETGKGGPDISCDSSR